MITNNPPALRNTFIIICTAFALSQICFWLLPTIFKTWDARAIDTLFQIRSRLEKYRPVYDDTVVHVDLNNTSLAQLKQFYINRSDHAQVIRNLASMQVAVQLYDFIFAAPRNPDEDRDMVAATHAARSVHAGLVFAFDSGTKPHAWSNNHDQTLQLVDKTSWTLEPNASAAGFQSGSDPFISFYAFSSATKGLGYLNITADPDGVFRRVPVLIRYKQSFYPSIAMSAVCDYLGVTPERILLMPGPAVVLKGVKRPGESRRRDIRIPLDKEGNLRINYIGPWERMTHYHFSDVWRAGEDEDMLDLWTDELSDKIVVVSEVTTGSGDIGPVPTDPNFPLSGLHANVIHTILTETFIRELNRSQMLLVQLLLLVLITGLALRFTSTPFAVSAALLTLIYLTTAVALFFVLRVIMEIVQPLIAIVASAGAIVIYRYIKQEKDKAVLRKSFESYFPPAIVNRIIKNPQAIASKGERKELTILFSDIKNFTGYSANLTPDRVQRLLNEYFAAMTNIVFEFGGTIDKFIGDGLMVFFGDPEPQQNHALRCVRAAIKMQQETAAICAKWEKRGDFPLAIRIGINTGSVFVGNMGSPLRMSYTVLGAAVNLASRLEQKAPRGGIMISQRTHQLVHKHVPTVAEGAIRVKGFDAPVEVYTVALDGQESRAANNSPNDKGGV